MTHSELKIPDLPWFKVEERIKIKSLREIGMLEWICHLSSSTPSKLRSPETYLYDEK